MITVQFNNGSRTLFTDLVITLVYRPPSSNEANTSELCKLLKSSGKNSLFIGDFNFPSIDWNLKTCDRKSENFLQAVEENEYDQLVDFKTHIRGTAIY